MNDLWNKKDWNPMLLDETFEPFNSNDYIFELKFDGIRAIIYASPSKVKIYSRRNQDITDLYPELKSIRGLVNKKTIFDGEIVAFENNKPSFHKLQERSHLKDIKKIKLQVKQNPVLFVCFDILYDGYNLTNLPLEKRKEILNTFEENDYFFKIKYIDTFGQRLFKEVKKINLEGIVAKKKESKYLINERSENWVKIKNYQKGKFYIGGYLNKKSEFVISLIVGEYCNDKLYCVGKVTLGKNNKLYNKILNVPILKKTPFVNYEDSLAVYIKPLISCEVKYLERTEHNNLRHPVLVIDRRKNP